MKPIITGSKGTKASIVHAKLLPLKSKTPVSGSQKTSRTLFLRLSSRQKALPVANTEVQDLDYLSAAALQNY